MVFEGGDVMNRMHQDGLKVLRIKGIIYSLILILIFIGEMVAAYFFEWPNQMNLGIISVVLIVLIPLVFVFLIPKYRYAHVKYQYDTYGVFIQNGICFIKQYRVPLYRVQNIEIEEGWLMRRFHLANIELSTAGGNVSIELIHKTQAQKLNVFVKQHGMMETYDASEENENPNDENEAKI
ncbi:hypothetical protein BUY16_03070 [Staphylococcus chromogenes]|nr:hypothetical protein BUY16_03070 [Staphylococcus chromogenes]